MLENRSEQKWAHPEILNDLAYSVPGSGDYMTRSLTREQYEEYHKGFKEPMIKAYEELLTPEAREKGEWTEYLTELGCPEEPDRRVRVSVHRPKNLSEKKKLPVIFYIVGGGLVSGGTIELAKYGLAPTLNQLDMNVIYVTYEYRPAYQGQYPAAINDGHAAYQWMIENAQKLQINTDKILIWGSSSGAHLALSLCFRLKRYDWCGAPMPRGVIPQEPPMEDFGMSHSNRVSFRSENGVDGWDAECMHKTYKEWLGEHYGDGTLGPEAVPNRATLEDVKGFPPVWFVSEPEFDPGRDGVYRFASLLHQAGIFCDVHVWGGGGHMMTVAQESDIAHRMNAVLYGAVRDALKYDMRRAWLNEVHTYNRVDEKWAHPESYEEGFYAGPNLYDQFYGLENIAFEELYARRELNRKVVLDLTLENSEEAKKYNWKYHTTEHGCPEEPMENVRLLTAIPKDIQKDEKLPGVLCFAGGGMINGGTAENNTMLGCRIVEASRQKVVMVYFEYRIAPMDPYPAAINDCHAAYMWMMEHAEELHIDRDKIVFWGLSSGGHASLCTAFRLKRYNWCGYPMPRGIVLQVPVMDDVSENISVRYSFETQNRELVAWDGKLACYAFKLWLGDEYGNPVLSPEAVPNRATVEDMKGYPPVWMPAVGEFDGGRDSAYKFAEALHEAGVFCDFHEWGGTNHSFMCGEQTNFAERFNLIAGGALRDALKYDFRRQWLIKE